MKEYTVVKTWKTPEGEIMTTEGTGDKEWAQLIFNSWAAGDKDMDGNVLQTIEMREEYIGGDE